VGPTQMRIVPAAHAGHCVGSINDFFAAYAALQLFNNTLRQSLAGLHQIFL